MGNWWDWLHKLNKSFTTTMIWTAVSCHYLNGSIKLGEQYDSIFIVFLLDNYVPWALTTHTWPHMKKCHRKESERVGNVCKAFNYRKKVISLHSQSNQSVSLSGNLAWEKEQKGTSHWRTLLFMLKRFGLILSAKIGP